MNVVIEDVGACRKRLKFEIPADEIAEERARVTISFGKQVRIPGFRPGKVPRDVIEKRFGKEIDEELQRSLVPKIYQKAVRENQLRVVHGPAVEDVEFSADRMTFAAVVDLAPEFTLPEYKGIPLPDVSPEPNEEQLQKALDDLRARNADFEDVEGRPIQEGDYAVISYKGFCDAKPLSEVAPGARRLVGGENMWIEVKPDSFLPGFGEALVGMNIGEERAVDLVFPADLPQEELQGKPGMFEVTLSKIKTKKLPELDEEYCQREWKVSLEQFKEDLRAALRNQNTQALDRARRAAIIDSLLKRCPFDLPETIVSQQTRSIIREIIEENQTRGVSQDELQEHKQEIFDSANRGARDRVRTAFILLRIAEIEKITVTPDEMMARVHQIAERHKMPPKKVLEEIEKHNGLAQIEEELLIGKTLDFLVSQARLEKV